MGDLDALLIRIDHLCADREWAGVARPARPLPAGHRAGPAAVAGGQPRRVPAGPGGARPGRRRRCWCPVPGASPSARWRRWRRRPTRGPSCGPTWRPRPEAGMVAHERVVRGEDLTGDDRVDPTALELPLRLQPWEPEYPLATYRAHKLEVADVPPPRWSRSRLRPGRPRRAGGRPRGHPGPGGTGSGRGSRSPTARSTRWRWRATRRRHRRPRPGGAACGWARWRRPTPWPSWPGPRPAGAPTAAGGGWPTDGSRPGGRSPPWPAASTTGRSVPTTWARPRPACAGTGGTTAAPATGWSLHLAVEDHRRGQAWAVRATDHA